MVDEKNYWTTSARRRISRRQMLKASAAAGLGIAALGSGVAGCSSQPAQQTSKPQTTEPKKGGTLNLALSIDPASLDPYQDTAGGAVAFGHLTGNTLVRYKRQTEIGKLTILPDLAESWEQPDDLTYIFKLRKGVKFQNVPPVNGRELVAEDVKYTYERGAEKKPEFRWQHLYNRISKIDTPDKYTIKLSTAEPYAPLMSNIAHGTGIIIAKEVVEKFGDLKRVSIGTGPFILKNYTPSVEAVFERNPDYFDQGKPYLDGVRFAIMPDAATRLAALRAKELDLGAVVQSDVTTFKSSHPDAVITEVVSLVVYIVRFQYKPPYDDKRVRQAVRYALNVPDIIKVAAQGAGKQAAGFISPALSEWALPDSEIVKQDIPKAKQLMAEAGFPNGLKDELVTITTYEPIATIVREQLKEIGIQIDIKAMEVGAYYRVIYAWDYTSNVHAYAGYEDPEPYFTGHFETGASFFNYSNPKLDAIVQKQRVTVDRAERKKLIDEAQRFLNDDLPYIYLYSPINFITTHSYVKGYIPTWISFESRYTDVWLDK